MAKARAKRNRATAGLDPAVRKSVANFAATRSAAQRVKDVANLKRLSAELSEKRKALESSFSATAMTRTVVYGHATEVMQVTREQERRLTH